MHLGALGSVSVSSSGVVGHRAGRDPTTPDAPEQSRFGPLIAAAAAAAGGGIHIATATYIRERCGSVGTSTSCSYESVDFLGALQTAPWLVAFPLAVSVLLTALGLTVAALYPSRASTARGLAAAFIIGVVGPAIAWHGLFAVAAVLMGLVIRSRAAFWQAVSWAAVWAVGGTQVEPPGAVMTIQVHVAMLAATATTVVLTGAPLEKGDRQFARALGVGIVLALLTAAPIALAAYPATEYRNPGVQGTLVVLALVMSVQVLSGVLAFRLVAGLRGTAWVAASLWVALGTALAFGIAFS